MPPRRNKTCVACINCSKSHVTCEDRRPCSRCIRKGLEKSCVDTPRKRRKYLADVPSEQLASSLKRSNNVAESQHIGKARNIAHKPRFMSNAVDSEYSILSDIIQQDALLGKVPIELLYSRGIDQPGNEMQYSTPNSNSASSVPPVIQPARDPLDYSTATTASTAMLVQRDKYAMLLGDKGREALQQDVDILTKHFPFVPLENPPRPALNDPSVVNGSIRQHYLSHQLSLSDIIDRIKTDDEFVSLALDVTSQEQRAVQNFPEIQHTLRYETPLEIYTLISSPFSHTSGFHSLLQYLRSRFNKADILEMCRSLAEFRPTFIAIAVTLTEEDMIFMEQCYQRTLLEYDQFISQVGTPTCVWRRNGQVSYVNDEFSLLTGWSRLDLLFKMTFIVELMDDESVREYFKTFNRVAYQDFKGSERMRTCRLLTPIRHRVIECCCIWTLKRDVFGLPLMIIGNFMPLLNEAQS
ncbi:LAME_0C07976g1_1 [Lachancea meyersii CBS 8951]|uniref:LAME_0C07976g1_1 n=1 Tax=Lachancea meyersii CBS 8951 TaxID=1266667 RepID=A0A1G4J3L8_9SACH|nr:LAME_0C07976g1_1 [Lachancea meyersii CBS 8951]